ncbi:MBG domain-containing protein [Sphingobacterium psychroaquaticum]|nr:MBG domain-containing protein [Sphingobacterium psychroaquaticum]
MKGLKKIRMNMKRLTSCLFVLLSLFFSATVFGQATTELFETESNGSTTFIDNGVEFKIISHVSVFDIQGNYPGTGWSGTANDNRYIDNANDTQSPPSFSIKTTSNLFKVHRFWLYLSALNLSLDVQGSVTITGRLSGVTKFSATKSSGFMTSLGATNGYTLIDLTNLNGMNFSNIVIDELRITANGGFRYVGFDAFRWVKDSGMVLPDNPGTPLELGLESKENVSCNGGSNGFATVKGSGGAGSYTYSWSPSGGTGATASGLAAGLYTVTVKDAQNVTKSLQVEITQPSALVLSNGGTENVSCYGENNGKATVNVTGGTAPYTYAWSPSGGTQATASNLAARTYTVTVTDAKGCFKTLDFEITQPSELKASTSQTSATCSTGGEASVFPSGGKAPYTYEWSTGAKTQILTGLAAGPVSCVIKDANGCSITKNFTIGTTNTLVASTYQTNILCNGSTTGSAGVIPSGAAGPFTYVWTGGVSNSDVANNLSAGSYSVLITAANGCSITKNFTITEPSALQAIPAEHQDVSCYGGGNGLASVYVRGGTGSYTYSWAPSGGTGAMASGLRAGTYTVTVTDANLCEVTQTITITQPDPIEIAIDRQDNVSCHGGSNGAARVHVTGGTGAYTYSWAPMGGTDATATGLPAGTYTVTVVDANSCVETKRVTITQPDILEATFDKTDVLCFGTSTGTATVVPNGGTAPYTYRWTHNNSTEATVSGLAKGAYEVEVTDAHGCMRRATVVIGQPASALSINPLAQTNIACNGGATGSATVSASGGSEPYRYSWSSSSSTTETAINLSAGIHTATVTDANGCQKSYTFNITEPSVLLASIGNITSPSAPGTRDGSASVVVQGGTPNYTYSWSPSGGSAATAKGLSAGVYTVTVTDANGCEVTATAELHAPVSVTQVTSTLRNGTYGIGKDIPVLVQFTKPVTVSGVPSIALQLQNGSVQANYVAGSGTDALTFNYKIQDGDITNHLDYTSTEAISLQGGSITDAQNRNAIRTLPAPQAAGSLSDNKTIIVDGIAPSGTLAINGGASFTGSRDVRLTLTVTEPSGMMQFSNDGTTWSSWESFAASKALTLPAGDGMKTVYARFKDEADNISALYNDGIVLDETPPAKPTGFVAVGGDGRVQLSWNANSESDFAQYKLFAQPKNGTKVLLETIQRGTEAFVYTDLPNGTSYTLYLLAEDHVGNQSVETKVEATTMGEQTISFASLPPVVYGVSDAVLGATASSGLPVSYISSDKAVAEVYQEGQQWKVKVKSAGQTMITASQSGNGVYLAAPSSSQNLVVGKATLRVTADAQTKVFGALDPVLTYQVDGLKNGDLRTVVMGSITRDKGENVGDYNIRNVDLAAINYTIDYQAANLTISKATLIGLSLKDAGFTYDGSAKSLALQGTLPQGASVSYAGNAKTEAGTYEVTATVNGGVNYNGQTLKATMTIAKATLTGLSLKDASFTYDGSAKSLALQGTLPAGVAVQYQNNNQVNAGTYQVTATIVETGNYLGTSLKANLTIRKAKQQITMTAPAVVDRDAAKVSLDVKASSGLPVQLTVDEPMVARINGLDLEVLRLGTVVVTASQAGNENYESAAPVSVTIRVKNNVDAELPIRVQPALSPNGDGINDFFLIEGIQDYPENKVTIFDKSGKVLKVIERYDNRERVFTADHVIDGTYFYYIDVKDENGQWKRDKGFFVVKR